MSKRRAAALTIGGIALIVALFVGWRLPSKRRTPDHDAALAHNTRGVALMDQFMNVKAEEEFQQAVDADPDWLPGQINLAIAKLNQPTKEKIKEAIDIFKSVLTKDPDNLHANYCLGLVLLYGENFLDSIPHFEAVIRKDSSDAGAWYWLAFALSQRDQDDSRTLECYEKAYKLNPYMSGPINFLQSRAADPKRADQIGAEGDKLRRDQQIDFVQFVYTKMGSPYGRAIGSADLTAVPPMAPPLPEFEPYALTVKLAPSVRWASAAELGGVIGELRQALRRRFGGTIITLDFDNDGRPDLLLLGAVIENGKLRDLLLHNDGGGSFSDVTVSAGLAGERVSLGCAAADFDNDGLPDLVITGAGRQYLFRNKGDGTFEDVTAKAGLDKLTDVCLGASWLDLEQDGDLDLLIARFAETPEKAIAILAGDAGGNGGVAVFLNIGEAGPVIKNAGWGALSVNFKRSFEKEKQLQVEGSVTSLAVTDVDGDIDVDVLAFADAQPVALQVNERLGRFKGHRIDAASAKLKWNGALALDADQDQRTDLLVLASGKAPLLLFNRGIAGKEPAKIYERVELKVPPLRQAHVTDIDLDGLPDVIGLTDDGRVVLLHNVGRGELKLVENPLPSADNKDAIACVVADLDRRDAHDIVTWSESGLRAWRSKNNGNSGIKVRLVGRREHADPPGERVNNDGIGARVTVQSGAFWTTAERATNSAGLGQSSTPMLFGLGRTARERAAIHLRWPDMVVQAEFLDDPKSDHCSLVKGTWEVRQTNRKPTSCPLLFTWDGEQWVYITDFLGEGSVGEMLTGGGTRVARPEESVKIEAHQLRPKDGKYVLRIAEPMDEIIYLDRVRLDVIDLPSGVDVFPDERFATEGPPPTQDSLYFRERYFAKKAIDHRGRDVTDVLRDRDGKMTSDLDYRSWLGFAGEHFVELDFGNQLATIGPKHRLFMVLAGWTDYPFPESIFAAKQAGIEVIAPTLERQRSDGKWEALCELGFPAGLPRVMTRDVTGLLAGHRGKLRIRTNMQIYWDQIFVAPALAGQGTVTELGVATASLGQCGMLREIRKPGSPLIEYDPRRADNVPVTRWKGAFTRFGDVTELLAATDDRYVIMAPGDDLTASFDASGLPVLPTGWSRQFVLRTWGWCKDASPFTATGGCVAPLPFRAMKQFPPSADDRYPHPEDLRGWHTRLP